MPERVEDCPRCGRVATLRFDARGEGRCTKCNWWCHPAGSVVSTAPAEDDSDDPNGWQVVERRMARDGR